MKKHVALSLLAITAVGVLASHLDIERHDDSYLLRVDGVSFDVRGQASAVLNLRLRHCDAIDQRSAAALSSDPSAIGVKQAISAYSPPDSKGLKLRQLLSSGPWFLAEVEFDQLQPSVILLEQNAHGWSIRHEAIWSGSSQPWVAGPWIRRYLQQRAPQVSADLWACFDPQPALFDSH